MCYCPPASTGTIDDALTRIYILGEYTFIFAIFFLTYNLVHLKGDRGTSSGGLVNKEVLKFWKYLYKKPNIDIPQQITKAVPDIHSDKDRAQSLLAALIYRLMTTNNVDQERYNALLEKIMEEGKENSDGANGEFSNGRNGKRCEFSHSSDVIDACTCTHNSVYLHVNVCDSSHCCMCVVNGNVVMAAC